MVVTCVMTGYKLRKLTVKPLTVYYGTKATVQFDHEFSVFSLEETTVNKCNKQLYPLLIPNSIICEFML